MRECRELSLRQRHALAEFTRNGGNQTQACAAAGYADPNAVATRVFRHPLMRAEIQRVGEAEGMMDDRLARKLRELLDAKTPRGYPDNRTRLAAVILACRLNGWLDQPRRDQITREIVQQLLPVVLEFIPQERLPEFRRRIHDLFGS
jgi:hypothetical protein